MYSDTQAYSSDPQEKKLFLKQLFFFHIINKWCIEELLCEQWFNERNLSGERNRGWKTIKDVRCYNSNQLSMVKDAWPNKAEFCSAIGEADAAVKDTLFLNKCFVTYHTSSHGRRTQTSFHHALRDGRFISFFFSVTTWYTYEERSRAQFTC